MDRYMRGSLHSTEYEQFLSLLVKARLNSGLTQSQVAKALKKPQSWVSKCESGERRVDVIELNQFAKLYQKPLAYFLGGRKLYRGGNTR